MNQEQFLIYEHLSYDMIATYLLASYTDNNFDYADNNFDEYYALDRMYDAMIDVIDPLICRIRIFPKWQFSDFALDNHHED
jgi:hypothetical protein